MPLPNIQQPSVETLDEAKARIEAAVYAAIAADLHILGNGVVEIEVPYSLCGQLRDWVESEGMRCACTIERNKKTTLVINMLLAPLSFEGGV